MPLALEFQILQQQYGQLVVASVPGMVVMVLLLIQSLQAEKGHPLLLHLMWNEVMRKHDGSGLVATSIALAMAS